MHVVEPEVGLRLERFRTAFQTAEELEDLLVFSLKLELRTSRCIREGFNVIDSRRGLLHRLSPMETPPDLLQGT